MFIPAPITEITGLVSSPDLNDGTGTWNVGVDLSTFVTVPQNATGVLIGMMNTSYQTSWWGLRPNGKTNAIILQAAGTRQGRDQPCPLYGDSLIDIYRGNSVHKFWILGFFDEDVTWYDIDGTLPTLDGAGGTPGVRPLPAGVSPGVSAILSSPAEVGTTGSQNSIAVVGVPILFMPAINDELWYLAYGPSLVYAEVAAGALDASGFGQPVSVVRDGTWRTAPLAYPGQGGVITSIKAGVDTAWALRQKGQTETQHNSEILKGTSYTQRISGLDVNGEFEYWTATSTDTAHDAQTFATMRGSPTQPIRKSSTFDIETTLGTITTATLNSVNVSDHVTGQVGTTVSFAGAATDEITTSGEYPLVLGDGTTTENITVQVNVVGLPANTARKDGGLLTSLTDLTLDAFNAGGTLVKSLTGITTDASGVISPVDLSDLSEAAGDTLKVSLHSAASGVGVTFEQALENI